MVLSSLEKWISPKSYRTRCLIEEVINRAVVFGLPERDVSNAREALEHNEAEVALDTVITQLFEYSIAIDDAFISLCHEACELMQIDWRQFAFAESLVKK